MTLLVGKLQPRPRRPLDGYWATATVRIPIAPAVAGGPPPDTVAVSVSADASGTGAVELNLPDGRVGDVSLTASAPDGTEVGRATIAEADLGRPFDLTVETVAPVQIEPSTVPDLGRRERLIGRVLDPEGTGAPAGLLVVIWAVAQGSAPSDAFPLVVVETAAGGYFGETLPPDVLDDAWAKVAGGAPVPIQLDDGRLPRTLVVVSAIAPAGDAEHDHDADGHDGCSCHTSPPRAPDQADLAANPAAFAADTSRCVDLTMPNRALEEVTFHAVVRTTQPEIRGFQLPNADDVPQPIVDRLVQIVANRPLEAITRAELPGALALQPDRGGADTAPAGLAATRAVPGVSRFVPVASAIGDDTAAASTSPLVDARDIRRSLNLRPDVVGELVRSATALGVNDLLHAERVSTVRSVRDVVLAVGGAAPGRVELGDAQIDWDDTPTLYQATTIAHGHLLTFKQVWRADGYSLGDLLYSLPLAPGQKKLIAVVDWDRREEAARVSQRTATETLDASLVHDRDISEVITSSLQQSMRGSSRADTSSVAAGIGGFIGPVVFGFGGGASTAGSSASQRSSRDVAGTMLNQARDRTLQAASAVRSQRSTVVQTARQGESLRVQTDVVANHNHCHALTVEYFEVLRHLQVSQEIAHVQECLFVPFEITPFNANKVLRHRTALARHVRGALAGGFDALERIRTGWVDADFPVARYADDPITYLDGELQLAFSLPRPADKGTDDDEFDAPQWATYDASGLLPQPAQQMWNTYLGTALVADRDRIFATSIAPTIAQRLADRLHLTLFLDDGSPHDVPIDGTLVSRYRPDMPLLVSLRPKAGTPAVERGRIRRAVISLAASLPSEAKLVVHESTLRYRTEHLEHDLVPRQRTFNDLGPIDTVELVVGLDRHERRNPRAEDLRLADTLIDHLNEHVEHFHQAIWREMDPNRRYLLLDGFLAPNAGGRSVASVVENRLIGIVGNCLVMPVVPGLKLDPSYVHATRTPTELIDLYATEPAPPMRVSLPTKGVFAEAILGACNSCEAKDDTHFWRWSESPIPDEPIPIEQVSTATRRGAVPNLAPDAFPTSIVRFQDVPAAPAPSALAAALELIGTPNLFADIAGLALNQANSAEALAEASKTATFFAQQGAALAQQRFLAGDTQRQLKRIKDARDKKLITPEQASERAMSLLKGASGERRPEGKVTTDNPAVQKVIDRVSQSPNASMTLRRPDGTVTVKKGDDAAGQLDVKVDPEVALVQQPTNLVCWAAAGTMMIGWQRRQSLTVETALDDLGGVWRARFDANQALSVAEVVGFTQALGLVAEGPASYLPVGIARLLQTYGPLWVISDDTIENNQLAHVRIVTGISGDGSAEGTNVFLVDPAEAQPVTETFAEFARRLEATDVVRVGLGIMHFPSPR